MYGIDVLIKEHDNILVFTKYVRKLCCDVIDGKQVNIPAFQSCINFARNYADKHHHGKEEQILFRVMLERLGSAAEKLIRNGMLVEHDLGRYHIGELERALEQYSGNPATSGKLDIITHAAGYADMLERHIEKENNARHCYGIARHQKKNLKRTPIRIRQFQYFDKGRHGELFTDP